MITALIFIAVIGLLVVVHEFGHFIMAKRAGMRVDEFGFGFPPRVWSIKKGETTYSINLIPFGGFVKVLGEDGEERSDPRSFGAGTTLNRFYVLVAGVTMNFLLAVLLLTLGSFVGLRVGVFDEATAQIAKNKSIQVISIAPNSPAKDADLRLLDQIIGFQNTDGTTYTPSNVSEVQNFTSANAGKNLKLIIKRGNEQIIKEVLARQNPPQGEGQMGIALAVTGVVSYPWYEAIWRGVYSASIMTLNVVFGYYELFRTLFTEGKLIADVSGPIGIANITGQAARIGFSYLMQLVALISINLAVLNILPLPALDGGRILFLFIEKIKGSPIKKEVEGWINATSFALLIALMIYVTIKDIINLF